MRTLEQKISEGFSLDPKLYRACRFILGAYIFVHFAQLFPYVTELFSHQGMLPDPKMSPLLAPVSSLVGVFNSPLVLQLMFGGALILSLALAVGLYDRIAAFLIWLLWAYLFCRNPLISNPSLAYIGVLLMAIVLQPTSGRIGSAHQEDRAMRPSFMIVLWVLMAAGYSYSGIHKCFSASWIDGTALRYVLENPLARGSIITQLMLMLPDAVLRLMTWASLLGELLFLPMCFFHKTRLLAWAGMLSMQIGILFTIDFADLTAAMVILHLFTIPLALQLLISKRAKRNYAK